MIVHVDFAVVFQVFCIVQGLTTAAYVLAARPRQPANRWLGILLLGLTLQVVDYLLSRTGVYYRNKWLYFSPLFFNWSFGPLLYAYVRARHGRAAPGWPHFVPGVVQLLFFSTLALQSFHTKWWFWLTVHKPYTRYVEYYGAILSMAVYLGLSWRPRAAPSAPWLRRFLLGLAGFYALAALDPLLNAAYLPAGAPKFYLTSVVLPVFAYWLALAGWRKSPDSGHLVVTPEPLPPQPIAAAGVPLEAARPPEPAVPAAEPAAAPPVIDEQYLVRIRRALDEQHLYRTPELSLDALAQHVGLPANVVSQALNAGLGKSFHELINEYRLAEVKRRLLTNDAQRFTVLALAFEAGFNSKTTFNRIFKEKTGLTPKDYRKKYQPTRWDDSVPSPG